MHIHGSARLWLCRSPWLRPSRPLSLWSPLAITLGCPGIILLVLELDKSFSWLLNPVLRHCPIRPQLTVFRRFCFSAQLIIILLISGIFRNTCHCERFGLSTGNNTLSFFPQLVRFIALASAPASSRSFSASFTNFLLTLATGLWSPSRRLERLVASVQVFFPCVKLSASYLLA